jgi:hypothetical protein
MSPKSIRLRAGLIGAGVVAAIVAVAAPASGNVVGASTDHAGYVVAPPQAAVFTATVSSRITPVDCSGRPTAPSSTLILISGLLASGTPTASGLTLATSCDGTRPVYVLATQSDNSGTEVRAVPREQISLQAKVTPTSERYVARIGRQTIRFRGLGLTLPSLALTTQYGLLNGKFPPFRITTYRGVTVDGRPASAWNPIGVSQVDSAGNLLVQTSRLARDGTAFALRYITNVAATA